MSEISDWDQLRLLRLQRKVFLQYKKSVENALTNDEKYIFNKYLFDVLSCLDKMYGKEKMGSIWQIGPELIPRGDTELIPATMRSLIHVNYHISKCESYVILEHISKCLENL